MSWLSDLFKPSQRPPDANATGAHMAAINKNTGISDRYLNATDQIRPWGNLSYPAVWRGCAMPHGSPQ
jgi:hypothetical protein